MMIVLRALHRYVGNLRGIRIVSFHCRKMHEYIYSIAMYYILLLLLHRTCENSYIVVSSGVIAFPFMKASKSAARCFTRNFNYRDICTYSGVCSCVCYIYTCALPPRSRCSDIWRDERNGRDNRYFSG